MHTSPGVASVFWHFIKFFEKFYVMPKVVEVDMSFQQSAWLFGESSSVFQANRRENHCFVGAAHVRPAAVRQTTSCGKGAGWALVGAQRAPTVCKQTRSCGCLPRRGQTLFAPRFRSTQPWSYAHNPAMPGPYSLARQLQRIHPPAILRRHQPHRRYSGGIGHNRLLPCPAFKIVALAGQ